MSEIIAPARPGAGPDPAGLVEVLLQVSLAGVILLRPLYAEGENQLTDFSWVRLNSAAQQMLRLPEFPAGTFREHYPTAQEAGVFEFYRAAFLSGQVERRQNLYQHDGLDGYYTLVAQRHEGLLVVSFTDANDQPRSDIEAALRQSQAAERAARAEAEAQRATLRLTLEQAPVAIAILEGPAYTITFANAEMSLLWGQPVAQVLGRPHFEALPLLVGQGFEEFFADVYRTGRPYYLREQQVYLDRANTGQPLLSYLHIVYQPLRDAQGAITGIIASAIEVTEQVVARHKVEQLNQDLEARVLERTQALRHAQAATEEQREQLYQVFEQTPVAIAILRGSNLRIELANAAVAAIWGREAAQVLGRPYFEAVPEAAGQGFEEILAGVLATGQTATITEAPMQLAHADTGLPRQAYVNFSFQPLRDAAGATVGVVASGSEVTEQVLTRQLTEQLNEELTASNEILETHVATRTREVQAARTYAEMQRSELLRVFEQAPVAIAVYRGPQYIIELANPVVCRLWGRTAEQIIGKGLFEALPEVAGMGFEELLDQVMATGVPYEAHAMPAVHDRDGRRDTVYWDFVYVPMYEADGRIYGAMVVATEVTEQVLARQQVEQLNQELEARVQQRTSQLGEQQGLLRQILGQVPAAIATLTGPEHRFTFFNDRYEVLSANRVVLGQTMAAVFPEAADQGFIGLMDNVYATGEPFVGTAVPVRLFDQAAGQLTQFYLDFVYQPLRDGKGQTQGMLVFIIDVTARVLAQRQTETLQAAMLAAVQRQAQQRQDLYQIFEQTPAAIVLLREPDHRIDYFNPAFEALFPPDDWVGSLRGHTLAEVYPRVREAGLVELLDGVYITGEPQVVIEMPLARLMPDSPRFVTFAYQAYREQERIVGVAAFVYDVTEQVLARQQVQQLNEEMQATNAELTDTNTRLTRTNADLDTFVYSASHDLKSPITNIEGLLLALRQQLPPAALQAELVPRLLDMMDGAVRRFQQTLGHLTDVSRLQQMLVDTTAETVDVPALVEAVRLDMLPELTAAQATLTVDLVDCPTVYFSIKNLRSILYNLLSNAIKYRDPTRPALVRLHGHCLPTGQAVLEVHDNGLGLTETQQAELFRLFRRLHSHVAGSGVGLYMVKKMVDNAGGTLRVRSQPGEGSTFSVTLPAARPPAQ